MTVVLILITAVLGVYLLRQWHRAELAPPLPAPVCGRPPLPLPTARRAPVGLPARRRRRRAA